MNQVGTNKLTTCETHHIAATSGGEQVVPKTIVANGAANKVAILAVEIVNYSANVANFNLDGANPATAADRVIQAGERLFFFAAPEAVNVVAATSSTLEINFWS